MTVAAGNLTALVGLVLPATDLSALTVESATLNGTPFVNATVASMRVVTTAELGPGPTLPTQTLHIVGVDNTANTIRLQVFAGTTQVATFTYVVIGYAADHLLLSFGIGETSGTVATQFAAHIDFNSVMAVLSLAQVAAASSIDFSATGSFADAPCFATGTRIRTAAGECPVEQLRPGDRVASVFGGFVPVIWVGRRHVDAAVHPAPQDVWPIRFRPGALADQVPARDLWLSPEHAVHLDGRLIPARCLVNGVSITQEPVAAVTYWHVELPQHDVLFAESAPCESYLDTGNRADFENAASLPRSSGPADGIWQSSACAPQCRSGAPLAAIRERLDALSRTACRTAA